MGRPRTEEAVPDTRQDHGIVPSRAFALAAYLDRWSGCAHHDLAASDSEPLTLAALLHLAGPEDLRRWRAADLGYADPRGAPGCAPPSPPATIGSRRTMC